MPSREMSSISSSTGSENYVVVTTVLFFCFSSISFHRPAIKAGSTLLCQSALIAPFVLILLPLAASYSFAEGAGGSSSSISSSDCEASSSWTSSSTTSGSGSGGGGGYSPTVILCVALMVTSPFQSLVVPTILTDFVPLELLSTVIVLPEAERPTPTS